MLACRDRGGGHLDVCVRSRQVHDQLHLGVLEHVLSAAVRRYAVLGSLRAGAVGDQVTEDQDLHVWKRVQVLQVGVADHPDADDADSDRAQLTYPPSVRNAYDAAMSSKTSPGAWSYSMTAYCSAVAARRDSASGTLPSPAWR